MAARHTILVTASELADELIGEAPPVLLDCRFNLLDPEEGRTQYREGHIPSALYLHLNDDLSAPVEPGQTGRHPLPDLSALGQLLARLGINRDTPVVIYDQHQAGFAGRCWWLLRHLGVRRSRLLDGGFAAWQAAGGQTEQTEHIPIPIDWEPGKVHTRTADAEAVERYSQLLAPNAWDHASSEGESDVNLLDARDHERYLGRIEPIDPVAGHIPGALCRPFTANLDDEGHFLPVDTLQQSFLALGLDETQSVVCYCGSGVTATINLVALILAGFETPILYPGSFSEWITDASRPIGGEHDALPN